MDTTPTSRSSFRPSDAETAEPDRRGSFRREPPVVPERVAVMKANYKQAWLFFMLGLCLLFAWGSVIRYALIRAFAFDDDEDIARTSEAFVSIAYEGISEGGDEVTPTQFREQISALEEAGYHAVTLEEVREFYQEGRPLPERSILVTFDHSRKSSYFDARKILQNIGWRAVMFVWTKPILDEDPSALRWPYIRAMINSGAWEAGAQSHQGFERIQSDSEGRRRNFLTSPQWLVAESRFETPEEFKGRLEGDHQFVFDRIERETNREPIAFAFPYGDFGQYDERALITRRLNMDLVQEYYDLAFILGNAALNTRYTNPHRLNRLLVLPEWSGQDLLERLEASWPQPLGRNTDILLSQRKRWQHDWGEFEMRGDRVTLQASDNNTGAKVWINGTDLYRDFSARLVMNIERGQAGLFLRASKDGESHLYLGLGDAGEVWLRQKHAGMESFTLGTSRYRREPDGSVVLDVFLRGNQFFASAGGEPIFDEIILTRGDSKPGMIGVSIWDPEIGAGHLDVLALQVEPFHNRMVTWKPLVSRQPYLAGWMSRNGYRFTMLAPPWLHLGAQGRAEQLGWNPKFFRDLANVYNMQFVPEIIVERIDNFDRTMAENLAERAARAEVDAVYCNLSSLQGSLNITGISNWIQNLSTALADLDIDLIVSLPPGLNRGNTVTSLLQGLDNLRVAAKEELIDDLEGIDRSDARLVSWSHVELERTPFPLFHQLTGGDADEQIWTTEVRSRLLWEQGFEAFQEGEFDLAIELWERWAEVEPFNEKPPRLIGDVFRRKQDYRLAVEYYERSLALNPGQISLVVTTAQLRNQFLDDPEGAKDMLRLYRRLFPANSEIALAQAELLLEADDLTAASDRIREVIDRNPEDLTALALLHDLLQTPTERVQNLEKMLTVGRKLGMYAHFANSIAGYDLLIWPESWRLMNLVAERAAEERPDNVLYARLLPRETVVREKFQLGNISTEWENSSFARSSEREEGEPLFLVASPTGTEAALKLRQSETMQNGFIEAELDEARGYFWLYARRSEGNLIRFGFEPGGKLYMQIWIRNEIVTNISRDWIRPRNRLRMRLEVRGDAVFGYIDGQPAFGAPIQIPPGMNLGWWGMAPWAPQFGVAQAVVREVAGGPLPMNVAVFDPKSGPWTDAGIVEKLKPSVEAFSVATPAWFFQDITGEVRPASDLEFPRTRLLTRYYKIRLYPMILSASARTLDVSELITLAKSSRVPGFTLSFTRMPDEEWFRMAEEELVGTGIGLLAMEIVERDGVARVRELGSAPSLISGPRFNLDFQLEDVSGLESPVIEMIEPGPPVVEVVTETEAELVEDGDTEVVVVQRVREPKTKPSVVSTPVVNRVVLF